MGASQGRSEEALTWEERTLIEREHPYGEADLDNAERLVKLHGEDIIYVKAWDSWLIFDGVVFKRDVTCQIDALVKDTIRSIEREAAMETDPQKRDKLRAHARLSASDARRKGMLNWTKHMVAKTPEVFDQHPDLIATANCVVNLRTKEVLSSKRDYLMTRKTLAGYLPGNKLMECPTWDAFILQFANGDEVYAQWLEMALGYCLFGHNKERKIFMFIGPTRTGKTVLLRAIDHALGDLSASIRPEVLLRQRTSSDRPEPEVAKLVGKRFVVAFEIEEGQKLAESKVKRMTGGDKFPVRDLYQKGADAHEMDPQFTPLLATNYLPDVTTDPAGWERYLPIPCRHQVNEEEVNPNLLDELKDEAHGILGRLINGAAKWYDNGSLRPYPQVVSQTISEYQLQSNPLAEWIEERTEAVAKAKTNQSEMYSDYSNFERLMEREPVSSIRFSRVLTDLGYRQVRTAKARMREGIVLKDQARFGGEASD